MRIALRVVSRIILQIALRVAWGLYWESYYKLYFELHYEMDIINCIDGGIVYVCGTSKETYSQNRTFRGRT